MSSGRLGLSYGEVVLTQRNPRPGELDLGAGAFQVFFAVEQVHEHPARRLLSLHVTKGTVSQGDALHVNIVPVEHFVDERIEIQLLEDVAFRFENTEGLEAPRGGVVDAAHCLYKTLSFLKVPESAFVV